MRQGRNGGKLVGGGKKPFISTHCNLSNFQLFQRRRFYRKRLWTAQQREIACLRSGKPVSKKIKSAIANNGNWVEFYDEAIKERKQKPVCEVA
jgi:hypothetical protein